MLEYIRLLATQYSYLGIFFLMFLESSIFVVPSELIMGVAGYLAFLGDINLLIATLFAALGNITGSTVLYMLSRFGKVKILYKIGPKVKRGIEKATRLFDRYDKASVMIAQFIPGIRAFISIPAGVFNMNYFTFIIVTFIGAFIWCGALGFIAFNLGQNWEYIHTLMREYEIAIFVVLIAIIFSGFGYILWHARKRAVENKTK